MKSDYEIAELAIKYENLKNMNFVKNRDILVEYIKRNPEFIQSAKCVVSKKTKI